VANVFRTIYTQFYKNWPGSEDDNQKHLDVFLAVCSSNCRSLTKRER